MATESFGMMDGTYFVSRTELLNWLNDLLKLNYTKVEQCCSGAAHCQIIDACYPGKVPLHKVNFNAKYDYEYVKNFKVLQEVFNKLGLQKEIDVERLIKGKYQDNLEFLQWMKRYYDLHKSGEYDAVARRAQAGAVVSTRSSSPATASSRVTSGTAAAAAAAAGTRRSPPGAASTKPSSTTTTSSPSSSSSFAAPTTPPPAAAAAANGNGNGNGNGSNNNNNNNNAQLLAELETLRKRCAELEVLVIDVEKERDFYFEKLRDIETICQEFANAGLEPIDRITAKLYEEGQ